MKYGNIKGTGLNVSEFCLGTMTFGGQTPKNEAIKIIDYAVDNGVNFYDTADIYTGGESEKILGKAISGKRDDLVIATKVCGPTKKIPNGSGLGRKHIIKNTEESLKRLNTDYIDILYMHFPDKSTPMEECIETMTNLVRSGKIRYYGVSNFSAWQCCSLIHKAKEMNAVAPTITETVYNILTRNVETEMVPFLKEYNMGMAVFNPLAGGLLTGKHTKDKAAEDTRFSLEKGYRMRYWHDENLDAVEELRNISKKYGIPMTKLALKWLSDKEAVDSIICGVSKYEHIVQNIEYMDDSDCEEALAKCDELWEKLKGNFFNYCR